MPDDGWRGVGNVGNYYGGLAVKEEDGLYFWSIENCDGHDGSEPGHEQIPESLYRELVKFDEETEAREREAAKAEYENTGVWPSGWPRQED